MAAPATRSTHDAAPSATDSRGSPPAGLHLAVALPLTVALMFWFLPRFKGLAVAWMWLLGLSGDENQGADAGD